MNGRTVLSQDDIQRALLRMSHEILEVNRGASELVLLGIPTRGVQLAERLAQNLARIENSGGSRVFDAAARSGALDITMYRDDVRKRAPRSVQPTRIPGCGIDGKTVILVDDVLFSGRTVRAAFDALQAIGRPTRVQLAVLVDRGHREFPIRADYVGKNLPSARSERINVLLGDVDGEDRVTISEANA